MTYKAAAARGPKAKGQYRDNVDNVALSEMESPRVSVIKVVLYSQAECTARACLAALCLDRVRDPNDETRMSSGVPKKGRKFSRCFPKFPQREYATPPANLDAGTRSTVPIG